MRTGPPDVELSRIRAALGEGWGLDDVELEYLPVGAGSYHWRAGGHGSESWFVTVDDLGRKPFLGTEVDAVFELLAGALESVAAIRHDGGLDFAVAPLPGAAGKVVRRIGPRFAIAVYPYLGEPRPFRKTLGAAEREALAAMLGELHRLPLTLAPGARNVTPEFPWRAELEAALDTTKPGPAGALLQANAEMIRGWISRFDALVARLETRSAAQVITHGEPHSGNIVRSNGRFMLVDWDRLELAPAERDLWLVGAGDPELSELYRLRWRLDDLSTDFHELQAPDVGVTDTEQAWRGLHDTIDHEPFTGD